MTVPVATAGASGRADGSGHPGPGETLRPGSWRTAAAMSGWAALLVAAVVIGAPHGVRWSVRAAPLKGSVDLHLTVATGLVLGGGIAVARRFPAWCLHVSWRRLLVGAAVVSLGWGLALSLTRGPGAIDRGLGNRQEYPAVVEQVDRIGVGTFVDTFTDDASLRTYPVHIQGHPLGAALLFVGLDQVGLGGAAGAAVFILGVSSTGIVAVLLTVREVAGSGAARRAAPFLALMPGMVWWVTSADALYATVVAWGIALVVLATRPGAGRRGAALALGGGVVWGLAIHLSYGLVPLSLVALVIIAVRRQWSALGWAVLGGAAVVAAFTAGGFWWLDGLAATRVRYYDGVASVRSNAYFGLLGNPAAFGLAVGPAAWVAFARVRERGLFLLAVPALVAVAVVDASGMSKAEVERIWLPFAPWVLLLAGGLAVPFRSAAPGAGPLRSSAPGWPALASRLLLAQVVLGVAVETLVATSW